MHICKNSGHWDSATVLAVHCIISASDALCIFQLGERSKESSHKAVLKLLRKIKVPSKKRKQVRDVLDIKNQVEYESRKTTPDEAKTAVKQAQRFLDFVKPKIR